MAITSNLYKLRSSLVKYKKFNALLPKRPNASPRFSDIDMFHTYNGHRLFIELKHINAKKADNNGVSDSIREMFELSMERGEYCLILWGYYIDHNPNSNNYYSEFKCLQAEMYNPLKQQVISYSDAGDKWLKRFFSYWYKTCDRYKPRELMKHETSRTPKKLPKIY